MLDELLELTNKFLIIPTYNYDFGKKKFIISIKTRAK